MSVLSQFMTGRRVAVITSSGTWTVPPGVNTVTIFGCGGGGGSHTSAPGYGGGAGQVGLWTDLPVTGISQLQIQIGAGGDPGYVGGTTSVTAGPYNLVMYGGAPGTSSAGGAGGGATGMAPASYGGTDGGGSGNALYRLLSQYNRIGGVAIGRPRYRLSDSDNGTGYGCGGSLSSVGTPSAGQSGVVFIIY